MDGARGLFQVGLGGGGGVTDGETGRRLFLAGGAAAGARLVGLLGSGFLLGVLGIIINKKAGSGGKEGWWW
jgi:hypothetical protein